jgi:glycosyltransferase involved in cell wall biosynthesis
MRGAQPGEIGMAGIDVIVPCYRYADYLAECVDSVLATEGFAVRVLILDDASPDHTPAVAEALCRKDARVTYRRHERNQGHIATYNEGLQWATAECLLLLSADDFVTPGALARAVALMQARPELSMVYGPFVELRQGEPRPPMPPADLAAGHEIYDMRRFYALNRLTNPVHTSTAVVRTRLQHKVGGYRPELTHSGDQEMWLRLALQGPVGYIDRPQGVWRKHGENMSCYYYADMLRDIAQRRAMLDILFGYPEAEAVADFGRVMKLDLAMIAARLASEPFGRGDVPAARRMMACARDISPAVQATRLWRLQRLKMMMGTRAWRAIRPLMTGLLGLSLDGFVDPRNAMAPARTDA